MEIERDDLKGLAKFTKKGELQSKIDRKNEEIDILKIGLSGIVKRYGYLNVQEFYRIHHESYNAYVDYKEKEADWEKRYGGDNPKGYKESLYERLKNQSERTTEYRQQNADKNKGRGAR